MTAQVGKLSRFSCRQHPVNRTPPLQNANIRTRFDQLVLVGLERRR